MPVIGPLSQRKWPPANPARFRPVFYTDIIATLRDDSLTDSIQTPHFVSQGTGREQFVDDARKLQALRTEREDEDAVASELNPDAPVAEPRSILEVLQEKEATLATRDAMNSFVQNFFDALKQELTENQFSEIFDAQVVEHADFEEATTYGFIIRVLSKEARLDNFVTAQIKRERKRRAPWQAALSLSSIGLFDDDDFVENFILELNCQMDRAQIKLTLSPKFKSLKRFQLVVTCAPSLTTCYVFEMVTEHSLNDFDKYDDEGNEVVRRWYKLKWNESAEGVVKKVASKLEEVVKSRLESFARQGDD